MVTTQCHEVEQFLDEMKWQSVQKHMVNFFN